MADLAGVSPFSPTTAGYPPFVSGERPVEQTPGQSPQDRLGQILAQKRASLDWMSNAFYGEWEAVYRNYKCLTEESISAKRGEPSRDQSDAKSGADDEISVAMPDTWRTTRTRVARVTAALPALKFRARDPLAAEHISTKVMYDWDQGGVQRLQKKHVLQADLFGWSVRPWYWRYDIFDRVKRVNPFRPRDPEETEQLAIEISKTYDVPVADLLIPAPASPIAQGPGGTPGAGMAMPAPGGAPQQGPPQMMLNMQAVAFLMKKHSRGGMLPVQYSYKGYQGAATDFLFVGDCFPVPGFESIQNSKWFMVERRRDLRWMEKAAKAYPELQSGFAELIRNRPNGSLVNHYMSDSTRLRWQLQSIVEQQTDHYSADVTERKQEAEWTITECHYPGSNPRLAFIGEESVWIGEIPYPYELQGQIAFSDCVLIDDILSGVGDSTARIIAPLNQLHNLQTSLRYRLVNNILRPLIGTSNRELYENPELLKRYKGFRLVFSRPGEVWAIGEQAALAAAAAGMNDEGSIIRMIQMASGDTNMSMAANVDPVQGRTATGARIMAYNTDILTKDLQDMLVESSIKKDAELIYLLNRSEMSDDIEVDSSRYQRGDKERQKVDPNEAIWAKITPEDFQYDAEVEVMVNSVLADDDESNVEKAQTMWTLANQRPDLVNVEKARDDLLIAMGKGKEMAQWIPPPAPPPPPPEPKAAVSITGKLEMLPQAMQEQILAKQFDIGPPEPGTGPEGEGGPQGPETSPEGVPGASVPGTPDSSYSYQPGGGDMNFESGPQAPPTGQGAYSAAKGMPLTNQ